MKYSKKKVNEIAYDAEAHPKTVHAIVEAFRDSYILKNSYAVPISEMIERIMENETDGKHLSKDYKIYSTINHARDSIHKLMDSNYISLKKRKSETYVVPKNDLIILLEEGNS